VVPGDEGPRPEEEFNCQGNTALDRAAGEANTWKACCQEFFKRYKMTKKNLYGGGQKEHAVDKMFNHRYLMTLPRSPRQAFS
jgi:sarcosine oxidase delta subunit